MADSPTSVIVGVWSVSLARKLSVTTSPAFASIGTALFEASVTSVSVGVTVSIVRVIAAVVPVALLTNGSLRTRTELAEAGLHEAFDHVFNSAETGIPKPLPESYLKRFEERAAETGLSVEDINRAYWKLVRKKYFGEEPLDTLRPSDELVEPPEQGDIGFDDAIDAALDEVVLGNAVSQLDPGAACG